jgi:hypothetical protein
MMLLRKSGRSEANEHNDEIDALADAVLAALTALHPRFYRNKSPQTPFSPNVVFYIDFGNDC